MCTLHMTVELAMACTASVVDSEERHILNERDIHWNSHQKFTGSTEPHGFIADKLVWDTSFILNLNYTNTTNSHYDTPLKSLLPPSHYKCNKMKGYGTPKSTQTRWDDIKWR